MPVIATPGNHEYLKDLNGRKVQLSAYWTSTFPFSYTWDAGPFYLARENYAVVFVQEDLFVDFIHKIQEINDAYPTSVLPLPKL